MIYGYTRVSTDQQADSGQSLEVQERALMGYCMMHTLDSPIVFSERGISGSIRLHDRPEGAKLLAGLVPGDSIITTKLDRMFRSALDALENLKLLTEKKVSLHMIDMGGDVTQGGMSKLMFTIASAFAEAERDRIRERIKDSKRHGKKMGQYLGGSIPFGFRAVYNGPDVTLEPDLLQQQAIADMHLWSIDSSLRKVSARVKTEYGFDISHNSVARILREGHPQSQ